MKIRNRIALLIVALFVLGTGTIAAYQPQLKSVTITDGGKVTQYETTEVLVGELLASKNIVLEEKDELSVDVASSISQEMEITITRWMPEVNLSLDGVGMKVVTRAYTIDQFIKEQGIVIGETDMISPKRTEAIKDGMELVIKRNRTVVETRRAELPYDVKIQATTDLAPGERKVKQAGRNGLVTRNFEVEYVYGQKEKEKQISSLIISPAQTEIILEGSSNVVVDPKTGKSYGFKEVLNMEATAYSDVPGDRWFGKTASGMPTFIGMIAVDPNTIPLGTKLYVEGYGLGHAGDTGGLIKGNIIDLFMNNRTETRAWGRRQRKVYILEDQDIDIRAARNS